MQRYAITDRLSLPDSSEAALDALVEQWANTGVEWVQLREKDLTPVELARLTRRLAAIACGSGTRLVVNGLPAALARECGADGVHLPGRADAAQIAEARAVGLVTVSCHGLPELEAVGGADAVLWAPVFGKTVRGGPVMPGSGLLLLEEACARVRPVPVFALGGVTAGNARACLEAGAVGVAGIRLFGCEGWRSL